ncbi:cas scaffolding protein family member 4 isoform X3 [Monodelphis domestica]|uniref:cas scaffolding protein family member 4 isoform X3 n=1 Tax=Monodelphis domestica TaxID=13616 RepID=UPI0024E1D840|nr:cas scaffolding protein family member 4 isoform X3 [Monodelphis domestica]
MKVNQCILAKALYDNNAECADELAFRRGDILTILEKNVPESEGWWKCSLHGRQGLAPANRLHLLTDAQEGGLSLSSQNSLEELPGSPEKTNHGPSEINRSPLPDVYEQMVGWVKLPRPAVSPSTDQVYEQPAPLTTAKVFTEKTLSFAKQDLVTLPRPISALLSTINPQVYDVPSPQRPSHLIPKEQEQQVYDIPASSEKGGIHVPMRHVYDVPSPTARVFSLRDTPCVSSPIKSVRKGLSNTLPNPQKPGWIYDTPVSPDKTSLRQAFLSSPPEQKAFYDIPPPRYTSTLQNSPNDKSKTHKPQNVLPVQKKNSLPEMPLCGFPLPRDILPLKPRTEYAVPPSFLIPRMEQQNTKPNIYDIPKGMSLAPQVGKDTEKKNDASENCVYHIPSWLPRHPRSISPEPSEQDRLSISSVDSRASISSCSSASTDPSSISSSEEPGKEVMLDLELAKEMVTDLQHRVASSIASLMIFVSSKWRFKEYLEANIDEIHRAADHIKTSLGEFLDFARLVSVNVSNLTDNNLQVRLKKQLQIIADSYQILLETMEALNNCNWSLDILITDKLQNNPDDLDRFVMVARTIPEDIKRFVSIIIANGKLLFKQTCEKEEANQLHIKSEHKFATFIQLPRRKDYDLHQETIAFGKPRESEFSSEPASKNMRNVCDQDKSQTMNLEDVQKTVFKQETEKKKDLKTKSLSPPNRKLLSRQDSEKKISLSEHCKLYFGGLLKAIGIFNASLSNNQPPEIFITQSKLIIMIGQKLVDSLCQETKEKDIRNEILCSSSQLCGLLKNLAVATKNAVIKYPNVDAIRELQEEADKLCKHTQQVREMLE